MLMSGSWEPQTLISLGVAWTREFCQFSKWFRRASKWVERWFRGQALALDKPDFFLDICLRPAVCVSKLFSQP